MNKISIVIPFYQKDAGLLTNALNSIRQQTKLDSIHQVVIVDDGSPSPARPEVEAFKNEPSFYAILDLVEQQNTGVSKARNNGLDKVIENTEFVAFLDPDDVWKPQHVELSLEGLKTGSDFHFSNFTHMGIKIGAFERAGYINVALHPLVALDIIHQYSGDMVQQITTENIIGTSTVIYRFSKYPNKRFEEQFHFAGEDYLMWLSITQECEQITFTNQITVNYGEGINLFSGAQWASSHLCRRLFDEINYRYHLLTKQKMNNDNHQRVKEMLDENRKDYLNNCKSMLKRLKLSAIILFIEHFYTSQVFRNVILKRYG